MVKRRRIFLIGAVLLGLLLSGAAAWLVGSTPGARWVLTQLPRQAGVDVQINRIEGALLGPLQLDGLILRHDGRQIRVDYLALHSRLNGLWPLSLDIGQLRLDGLQVSAPASREETSPIGLHWPEAPRLLGLVQMTVTDFMLHNGRWQTNGQPVQVDRLSGDLSWHRGQLTAEQLRLETADLNARADIQCNLAEPRLTLDVYLASRPGLAWQELQLRANLRPGSAHALLGGPFSIEVRDTPAGTLSAAGELAMTGEALLFRQVRLHRPGQPGEMTAKGRLLLRQTGTELAGDLQLSQLDLRAETGQPLRLSGSIRGEGTPDAYQGSFTLSNAGENWADARLAGTFAGDTQQLTLQILEGSWLAGRLDGQVSVSWQEGWQAAADLTGTGIDPQQIDARLAGQLNLHLDAGFTGGKRPLQGQISLQLHESVLHQQPLDGTVQVTLRGNVLHVAQLQLHGRGLRLQASGNPAEHLTVAWQIDRLEELLSDTSGHCRGEGWLRWRDRQLAANLQVEGEQLVYRNWRLGTLNLHAAGSPSDTAWQLRLGGKRLEGPWMPETIDRFDLTLQGIPAQHRLTLGLVQAQGRLNAVVTGAWQKNRWDGTLHTLLLASEPFGHWTLTRAVPVNLARNEVTVAPLRLQKDAGGSLLLQGAFDPSRRQGTAQLRWQQLPLAMLAPWLPEWTLSGHSSGSLELLQEPQQRLQGSLSLNGTLERHALRILIAGAHLDTTWDQRGLDSRLQLQLIDGSRLQGSLTSPDPVDPFKLKQARLQLAGRDIPLEMLHPWLPSGLNLAGMLNSTAEGTWQSGTPLQLKGTARTENAHAFWEEDDGIIRADISSAELNWQWANRLQGSLSLLLREQGQVHADFALPLTARLPFILAPTAPLSARVQAELYELGLASVLFPGRVQESRGRLQLDLQLAGSRQQPELTGSYQLSDAEAFLPTLGIPIKNIALQGDFSENRVNLNRLQLDSGEGRLEGSGQLQLTHWRPGTYQLQLRGENIQLVNLPELQIRANPDLSIEGEGSGIRLHGRMKLPSILLRGKQKTALASNSPDLIILDRPAPPTRTPKLQHDIDLDLVLGEQVLLNTAGIDARLEGSVHLQSTETQEIAATGTVQVAKGRYASYGVHLDISRGLLHFTGGPVDQPTLDILATRTAGEVQAGVKVTGTPKAPIVQLYAEPAMADTDILSYIVFGRPIGADRSQTGMLMAAAGALLSQGESVTLQEKLKSRLGLDVLDISAGDGDVTASVVTTGKYLSPDLYVSLGYSLFTRTNELKVRYRLTPAWEIESSFGIESGADIYYRIEFE